MNRTFRVIANIATVPSLVLCAATVALWARSYWVADVLEGRSDGRDVSAGASRGVLTVGAVRQRALVAGARLGDVGWRAVPSYAGGVRAPRPGEPGVRAHASFAGFGLFRTDGGAAPAATVALMGLPRGGTVTFAPAWQASAPHAALAAAFAVAPAAWFLRRRRPSPPGLCPACGYDLRATPDRCPECGAVPTR
jgi:hypothetical protein